MTRKEIFLVALVLVLGGLYAIYFTDWFGPKPIRVEHTVRSLRDAYGPGGRRVDPTGKLQLGNVTFALHREYKLTSVRVVLAADAKTNKYPHALWHLISKDGSQPVDSLCYGMPVTGMTPESAGLEAEALESGVEYRLLVEARSRKGLHDFTMPATARAAR